MRYTGKSIKIKIKDIKRCCKMLITLATSCYIMLFLVWQSIPKFGQQIHWCNRAMMLQKKSHCHQVCDHTVASQPRCPWPFPVPVLLCSKPDQPWPAKPQKHCRQTWLSCGCDGDIWGPFSVAQSVLRSLSIPKRSKRPWSVEFLTRKLRSKAE